jgi:hypothetical protein
MVGGAGSIWWGLWGVLGSAGEEPAGSNKVGIKVMVYVEMQYVQSKGQWDGGMMMAGKSSNIMIEQIM